MKKISFAMAIVASATIILPSCSSSKCVATAKPKASEAQLQEARSLYVTVDELAKMTPEQKSRRKDNLILAEHINLDKDARTYSLAISKEEALKLGVSEQNYTQVEKELSDVNLLMQQHDAAGDSIAPIDLVSELQNLKANYRP